MAQQQAPWPAAVAVASAVWVGHMWQQKRVLVMRRTLREPPILRSSWQGLPGILLWSAGLLARALAAGAAVPHVQRWSWHHQGAARPVSWWRPLLQLVAWLAQAVGRDAERPGLTQQQQRWGWQSLMWAHRALTNSAGLLPRVLNK